MDKIKIKFVIDILMALAFLVSAVTGVVLWLFRLGFLAGSKHDWNFWHTYSSIALVIIVALHLALNFKWMVCMTKNLWKKKKCD